MLTIRQATLADAPRLLEIYAPYVGETAISFEYAAPSLEEFQRRISSIMQRYPYVVAEENGRVWGYAYASAFKEREAFRMTVETSVYVDAACRQQGIGRQLYIALEEQLHTSGFQSMFSKCDQWTINISIISELSKYAKSQSPLQIFKIRNFKDEAQKSVYY